ncbi:hypothetical protein ATCVTN60342_533L [Acanthocystis turfacea Chlorella virus TN603.4.2]|nr:hypothetical protein ATCVTN60342_533L [Acanthocystis turfacea Chlorella virus TN603.4.2]
MIPAKLQLVLFASLVFMIVSNPMTYKLTNIVTSRNGLVLIHGDAPTRWGIFLHAIVFGLILYTYLMTFQI